MPKLHEVLAIESNLETQATKVRGELADTFAKKRHLFEEKTVTFQSNTEGAAATLEAQSSLQSTVLSELDWISKHLIRSLDASYQVAEANMLARADVVLDDEKRTVLLKGLPATALLELEKRLTEIRELLAVVPTLDPAKSFTADDQRGHGIFKAREVHKARTKKDVRVIVKYDATPQHPAQTELVPEDRVIGTIIEREWSGMITPAQKAELLTRAEATIRAVRAARSRANDVEADVTKKIGHQLLSFILEGK